MKSIGKLGQTNYQDLMIIREIAADKLQENRKKR
jgi:hypothetical protein